MPTISNILKGVLYSQSSILGIYLHCIYSCGYEGIRCFKIAGNFGHSSYLRHYNNFSFTEECYTLLINY